MKKTLPMISLRLLAAVSIAVCAAVPSFSREWLIKSGSQLSSNATSYLETFPFDYLIDGNTYTFWYSDYNNSEYSSPVTDEHYIEVDFGSPLTLGSDEDIVVYTRRRDISTAQPTTMRIEGRNDASEAWSAVAHAYFVYRGPKTDEYSSRIHPSRPYRYLRFTVTANNSRSTYRSRNGRDIRFMNMAEFNILRLGRTEDYREGLVDRFRLTTDYIDLGNIEFERTHGIADARNRRGDGQKWLNLDGLFDGDGNWTVDGDFWDLAAKENYQLEKPDMTFLTSDTDKDIKPGSGGRQPSNVMEHVLYAVPGDAIALYPYYDFRGTTNYRDRYVHWYDYYTGGGNEYLDFLVNPENVVRTDNNGYFGGASFTEFLAPGDTRLNSLIATFMVPRDVYAPEGKQLSLEFPDGRDEYVIACDMAQEFTAAESYDIATKKMVEPTVSVRHLFRIRDGRKFAEDNMSTVEKNREYINRNVRYINAPAGKDFQFRFDSPVPCEGTTRSKWYYKAQADGSDYRRICSMDIEVYDEEDRLLSNNGDIFYGDAMFKGYGSRTINGVEYQACGGGGSYNRMLACNASNAIAGKSYVVRLVGKDINGNRIIIPDGSGAELWVQEFRVTFLGDENASVVSDSELMSNPAYENRRPDRLHYLGELRDVINYDDYAMLLSKENVSNPDNYFSQIDRGKRYKFSMAPDEVNYTFGYNYVDSYDYSNYFVVNHSDAVYYHGACGPEGLFDRRYVDTGGREQGFFFYINAASDPGVMGKLRLDGFCVGSTVHVSGWYAECSSSTEVANLAFNFVAVLDDGRRVPIHTFVSGYVPAVGIWHNIYYSFIPDMNHLDKEVYDRIDHYELELDNNCRNSSGADYGIDDIRVYISTPDVEVSQTRMVCDNSGESAALKVSSPFGMLLQSLGIAEAKNASEAQTLDILYSFIDKEVYDEIFARTHSKSEAYEAAVLKFPYRDSAEDKSFGHLYFYNYYDNHREYDPEVDMDVLDDKAFRELVGTEKWITFNTRPKGENIRPGKEFYVVLYTPMGREDMPTEESASTFFDPMRDCAKVCSFRVKAADQIKIDGNVIPPGAPVEVCEGQRPVVQLDVMADKGAGGDDSQMLIRNAYFDWYAGDWDEFMAEKYTDKGGNSVNLRQMLAYLRTEYPDSTRLDLCKPKGELTEEALEYMKRLTEVSGDNGQIPAKLHLRSSSYVFAPVYIPEGQDMAYAHVVAVPFDYLEDYWLVCTAPTEVSIAVRHRSPGMTHGFAEGIEYPEGLADVPLRIGLRQLKGVSAPEGWSSAPAARLTMPIRDIEPASAGVSKMTSGADPSVYLAATDDPSYQDLGSDGTGLMAVGEVVGMLADTNGTATDNAVEIVFYDSFVFKEGYRYTMRYNFEELSQSAEDDGEAVCHGQDSFTLLVVPEYMKWMGTEGSTDWANDLNWHRASSADLHYTAGEYAGHDLSEHIGDGTNGRIPGFAPLDFTNVLVSGDRVAPELYVAGDRSVTIGKETFVWSASPEAGATDRIQYHMAARSHEGNASVDCRPWLANECDEIHFGDRSEMSGQDKLRYNRAHVEVELAPSRWYVMSSPLEGIVAGDMYMPTAGARQETELYMPIRFDRAKHDRFAPAVFQRSWNRGEAWVHEIPDGSADDPRTDVFVETTWSGVYNEVNERYLPGTGFSIKVDGSTVGMAPDGKALLRLPKDDMAYDYYSDDDKHVGTTTTVRDIPAGRLNATEGEIVLEGYRAGNRYFMVGNPFMSHMDMVEFLTENSGVIYPKYWILTSDAQEAAVMSDAGGALVSNAADARYVGPMQGFFVEAREPVAEGGVLKLRYNRGMSAVRYSERGPLKMPEGRGGGTGDAFTVSVVDGDDVVSSAVVAVVAGASPAYDGAEDAAAIFDPSLRRPATVYTFAGDVASSINLTPDAAGTEIGLRSTTGEGRYTLRFTGVDNLYGLSLYDKADGSLTPLSEGLEIEVEGDVRRRLYLMSDMPVGDAGALSMRLEGSTVTVASGNAGAMVSATVYDTMGRTLGSYSTDDAVLTFDVDPGIYIIEGRDGNSSVTRKFAVR